MSLLIPGGATTANRTKTYMAVKLNIRKLVSAAFWSVAGAGVLVLLIAAIRYRNANVCRGFHIEIAGSAPKEALFVDKKGIADILTAAGAAKGQNKPIHSFDLRHLESALGRNVWIKEAQLFFDNNDILQVKVVEREPVARVFTRDGNSCYVDSGGMQLPLPDKGQAQLPVFTGYPAVKLAPHGVDSLLTRDILRLAGFLRRDSFWAARISQIAVLPGNNFELEPATGDQRIVFGNGSDIEAKFHRLALFYKDVLARTESGKYNRVDISYAGQIVATKTGREHGRYDSVQGMNNIRQMIRSAQQLQPDTLRQQNVRPLEQSTATEQSLGTLDLLPEGTDSLTKPPKNRKKTTNNK
jgi:cell division protein FtsQ